MATDAAIYPISPVWAPGYMAWPTARRVQSSQGMAETKATNGAMSAEERKQARAPEMELIREAQAGSRAAFDTLVRQYEQQEFAQADGHGHLAHVLTADQLRANARQLALMPLGMQFEKGFGHHQAQHGIAQKLQALIVAHGLHFTAFGGLLVGQGAMRQSPLQKRGAHKAMAQRGFQSAKNRFHMRLDSVL